MNAQDMITGIARRPIRTARSVAGATLDSSLGVAAAGLRTTGRIAGWLAERAGIAAPRPPEAPWATGRPATAADASAVDVPAPQEEPVSEVPIASAPAQPTRTAPKTPAKKTAARKTTRKAPSKKAAVVAPALGLTEAEAEDVLRTPSGIPAAGDGINPDTTETDLHQPGTEPLMDPATVKSAVSEADVMRRASDVDKG